MKNKHLQKITSLTLFSAGLTGKHLQKIISFTLSYAGFASKHLQKIISIILSSAVLISKRLQKITSFTLFSAGLQHLQKITSFTLFSAGLISKHLQKTMLFTLSSAGLQHLQKITSFTLSSAGLQHLQKIMSLTLFSAGLTVSKYLQKITSFTLSSAGLQHLQKITSFTLSSAGLQHLQKITSFTLSSAGLKHLQKTMLFTLSYAGLTGKHLQKLAIVLSCMSLLHGTDVDSYQLHLRFLSGNAHKTEHNIGLTQAERDMIVRNGLNNELALRLETILNQSSLEVDFYSLDASKVPSCVQIEEGKLIVTCVLQPPKFHLILNRGWDINRLDRNLCQLALRSPWITKSLEMMFMIDRAFAEAIPNEMNFDSMEEIERYLERYLPTNHEYGAKIDGQLISGCITTDPTKIEHIFREAYFLDSLSNKMGQSISDIIYLLNVLAVHHPLTHTGYLMRHGDNEYSIGERLKDSDIDVYQLFFVDEKYETRNWYNPEYSHPITNVGLRFNPSFTIQTFGSLQKFPTCPDGGLILKSIKLAGKTYQFTGRLDIGYEPVCEYVIQTSLKRIKDRLSIGRADMFRDRYRETWNSINLEEACKSIEQDISFINSLALQANREPSDMIRLLAALNIPSLNKHCIVQQTQGRYVIKVMQDQILIYEIFFKDSSNTESWYKRMYNLFLGCWIKNRNRDLYREVISIDKFKLFKQLPDEVILDQIKLGAETYSFDGLVQSRARMVLLLNQIDIDMAAYTSSKLKMVTLVELEAKWNSIRLVDIMDPIVASLKD